MKRAWFLRGEGEGLGEGTPPGTSDGDGRGQLWRTRSCRRRLRWNSGVNCSDAFSPMARSRNPLASRHDPPAKPLVWRRVSPEGLIMISDRLRHHAAPPTWIVSLIEPSGQGFLGYRMPPFGPRSGYLDGVGLEQAVQLALLAPGAVEVVKAYTGRGGVDHHGITPARQLDKQAGGTPAIELGSALRRLGQTQPSTGGGQGNRITNLRLYDHDMTDGILLLIEGHIRNVLPSDGWLWISPRIFSRSQDSSLSRASPDTRVRPSDGRVRWIVSRMNLRASSGSAVRPAGCVMCPRRGFDGHGDLLDDGTTCAGGTGCPARGRERVEIVIGALSLDKTLGGLCASRPS